MSLKNTVFIAIGFLAVIVVVIFLVMQSKQERIIKVVVPNNFVGLISIKDSGAEDFVDMGNSHVSTYVVPVNGQLCTHTIKPFSKWHILQAEYYNGESVLVADNVGSPQEIALRQLFGAPDAIWFIVGTKADWDSARESGLLVCRQRILNQGVQFKNSDQSIHNVGVE